MKTVNVEYYITTDGTKFEDKVLAEDYQKQLDKPKCEHCNGKGIIYEDAGHDCWGRPEYWSNKCPICNGTGKEPDNILEVQKEYLKYLELKSKFK